MPNQSWPASSGGKSAGNPAAGQSALGLGAQIVTKFGWAEMGRKLGLSRRELDVLQGVFDCVTEGELAARLGISEHTVHTHFNRLFKKVGVRTRVELVLRVMAAVVSEEGAPAAGKGALEKMARTSAAADGSAEMATPKQPTSENQETLENQSCGIHGWWACTNEDAIGQGSLQEQRRPVGGGGLRPVDEPRAPVGHGSTEGVPVSRKTQTKNNKQDKP
jgi:DNA-binding CsgD family transcriptional regulator